MTGMKCLPANSRSEAWDADLSTAPLKGVPIGSQDLFRGGNRPFRALSGDDYAWPIVLFLAFSKRTGLLWHLPS